MTELDKRRSFQDLAKFRLPDGFRGRPAGVVLLWWFVEATLFRWSPQVMYGWRRWLLRTFGANIGIGVRIRPTAKITFPWKVSINNYSWVGDDVVLYSLGEINIGENAVISQRSYVCTGSHDITRPTFDIFALPISIGDGCWIASDVYIAPGIAIADGAVVGARSTVFSDLPSGMVCYGSPAIPIRTRDTVSGDRK